MHRAYTPAPQTQGAVLDQYLAQFKESIAVDKAVMLRALVANQQWAIDKIAPEIDSNKRDKLGRAITCIGGLPRQAHAPA